MNTQVKIAVVVADKSGDKTLLIKEKIKKKDRPLWNVVKGSYGDNNDESIFEAAQRECLEEASIKVELTGTLGTYISKKGDRMRIQFNFIAKIIEGEPKLAPMDEQKSRDEFIQEIEWFSKEDLSKMSPEEFISNRSYQVVQDWLSGSKYPLDTYKHVEI